MKSEDALKEMHRLQQLLQRYDHAYYVEDNPIVSDSEYDQVFKTLQALEEQFPQYVEPNSPTQRYVALCKNIHSLSVIEL